MKRHHATMLLLSCAAIVGAWLLEVRGDGRVGLRLVSGWDLPHTCFARVALGVDCPACGLTRSFIHLADGRWSDALAVHRLGWLLALATLLQVPYRAWALVHRRGEPLGVLFPTAFAYTLIALLIGNWILGSLL
ncbi:MAG: DUF2752 domain-containing protein [Planctomycetes bacterium]|nr:DUF2752 domain-containing protein [Planctomycetota bacterium]